ncbi:MAG TPA: hypothetical protein VD963_07875 [Phycisphaerales bacterium]|nr:hypothetical protein [Phycisphaerales bacterium]
MSMTSTPRGHETFGASFLPEDYLRRKLERRTNLLALGMFSVVMFGVVAAFFVTNRQWSTVKRTQLEINTQYATEAKKIEQLKLLEAQKGEMLEKAEITAALIERVPRSILLAEVINRMPPELTLTEVKLTGKRVREAPPPKPGKAPADKKPRSISASGAKAASTAGGAGAAPDAKEAPKPAPPKFEFVFELVGLASTDERVADYHTALKQCPLLAQVDLAYSNEVTIDEVSRRKFRIEAQIRPTADARKIEPLLVPRAAPVLAPDGTPIRGGDWLSRLGLTPANPEDRAGGIADAEQGKPGTDK